MSTTITRNDFAKATLAKLGMPQNEANVNFLVSWMALEGSNAAFNPGATTLSTNQVVSAYNNNNGNPVKNYASFEAGVEAWAKTFKSGRYAPIMKALKSGDPSKIFTEENIDLFAAYSGNKNNREKGRIYSNTLAKLYKEAGRGRHGNVPIGTDTMARASHSSQTLDSKGTYNSPSSSSSTTTVASNTQGKKDGKSSSQAFFKHMDQAYAAIQTINQNPKVTQGIANWLNANFHIT